MVLFKVSSSPRHQALISLLTTESFLGPFPVELYCPPILPFGSANPLASRWNSHQWLDEEIGGTLDAYKQANPTHKSMMVRILKAGYSALQLIHYFTAGADEVRGWTIKDGWFAPQAAGANPLEESLPRRSGSEVGNRSAGAHAPLSASRYYEHR